MDLIRFCLLLCNIKSKVKNPNNPQHIITSTDLNILSGLYRNNPSINPTIVKIIRYTKYVSTLFKPIMFPE